MQAKLVGINGALRNSEFPIHGELSVGRDADNVVQLEDGWVSAHHCNIAEVEGRHILRDLESHAGTFVNGIPIKQRELSNGDEVAIGNSLFVFQEEKAGRSPSSTVKMDEEEVADMQAVELPAEELRNLTPERLAALEPAERLGRNLSALLGISRAIGSLRDEESLPWQLLGMIFDVVPAERGAILLMEENTEEVRAQVAWDRVCGPEHPVHVSQSVLRRVLREGACVWNCGARAGGERRKAIPQGLKPGSPLGTYVAAEAATHKPAEGRAFVCVPMACSGRTMGVIYLESSEAVFSQADLELLAAIAGLGVVGIENARQFEKLKAENQRLQAEVSLTHDMVGQSARMREVYQMVERVASSDSTVLIYGESGTGKELTARAIHKNSARKEQVFVGLNCAALTETLLESELFGHEKGAFTSAVNQKKGYLEVAEGGTIFLDEIGELSPILQAKLLRVLQEREFVRVGGTRPIKIDVRFLAATNKDLQKAVKEEKFRADLFHRLNVISLTLPALRERPEDIRDLAEHFVARYAKKCNRRVTGISEEALACLRQYDWPGNIRELENAMERAVVIGNSERILAEDLPEGLHEGQGCAASAPAKYHDGIREYKSQMILSALEQAAGNVTEAAKLLGVHANYLHRLMRNLELRPKMRKQTGA
ncbi:MAG TPA: sigma 54-interacting transcriptional regulator [Candidatus Sulfotelmatobacter sp.]|nr:sigma 54-interacting transcriptional regulator [Candidatus Sulfotelmatobacter sp.]